MTGDDQQTIIAAIGPARQILKEYIEPRARDAISTLDRLRIVLDDQKVVSALDTITRRKTIGLVE